MSIERFNEGLLIGLSVSGLNHIKKIYNVNQEFIERFSDGLLLSKVLQLEATYTLNTIITYLFEEDVNPNPPEPPEGDKYLYLINRFKLNTKALTTISKGLFLEVVDEGLKLKTILNIIGKSNTLDIDIEDRYILKSELKVLLNRYRGLYAECLFRLKTDVNVVKSITDRKLLELEEQYLLGTILEIEGAIQSLEGVASDVFGLNTGLKIVKHSTYRCSISDVFSLNTDLSIVKSSSNYKYSIRDIFGLKTDLSIVKHSNYVFGVEDNYKLNDYISIVKESFNVEEDDDDVLKEYVNVDDDINIVVKDIITVKQELNIIKIEDELVKIEFGGKLEEYITDNLDFGIEESVFNVVKDIHNGVIGDTVSVEDDVVIVVNDI